MTDKPTSLLDNYNILQEIQNTISQKENATIHRMEQREEFFQNYSFQDAILKLDKLFDF